MFEADAHHRRQSHQRQHERGVAVAQHGREYAAKREGDDGQGHVGGGGAMLDAPLDLLHGGAAQQTLGQEAQAPR